MKIFDLSDIPADALAEAGGKARGLNSLIKANFNVPPGLVIIGLETAADLDAAAERYVKSKFGTVAVRSSATAEDGEDFSSAGQYKTVLNVRGAAAFKKAALEVLRSLTGDTARSYSDYFKGVKSAKMALVVQKMITPDFAGVCFTAQPGKPDVILVEAVAGLGEALVSGEKAAERYEVDKKLLANGSARDFDALADGRDCLTGAVLKAICEGATEAEKFLRAPADTEFAVAGGAVYWLQARPVTVTAGADMDEFDPKIDLGGNVVTRCNIGEMLPGAVTPLTVSTNVYAIDRGMRKMLVLSGAYGSMSAVPEYSCAFPISGHLFLNLSTLYRMENTIMGAGKNDIDISLCGRVLSEGGDRPAFKADTLTRLNNMRKYFTFLMSRNKARKTLARFTEGFSVGADKTDAASLYGALDGLKHMNDRATYLHYITSAHSGAMSSAMLMVIKSKLNDEERSKCAVAEILEDIDDIESVDILRSLRVLGRAVLSDNPAAADYGAEELSAYLKKAGGEARAAYENFMKKHGHRAIREAEMRSMGWADDERAFCDYLKTVIRSGAAEPVKKPARNYKEILRELGFRGLKKGILSYLARQSRAGVRNREYSKSRMIKVMNEFKKAYRRLADMLVAAGTLPDADLIYFLTHEEIGRLVAAADPKLIKAAIARRRLLPEQSALQFNDVYTGKPEPARQEAGAETADALKGAPISRGLATGRARVVRSAEDAAKLQKGEIMVAAYTDIGWSPYYCLIEGLVTEVGSALSHGAVVAREYALPLVANVTGATRLIKTGDMITVNGSAGTVTRCA